MEQRSITAMIGDREVVVDPWSECYYRQSDGDCRVLFEYDLLDDLMVRMEEAEE